MKKAERACAFPRGAGDAFSNGHPEQRRTHVHAKKKRRQRRAAGIAIGRQRHPDAVAAEQFDRRLLRFANEVEGTRKHDGDRHGRGQRE